MVSQGNRVVASIDQPAIVFATQARSIGRIFGVNKQPLDVILTSQPGGGGGGDPHAWFANHISHQRQANALRDWLGDTGSCRSE
jgi:hypothetical protein